MCTVLCKKNFAKLRECVVSICEQLTNIREQLAKIHEQFANVRVRFRLRTTVHLAKLRARITSYLRCLAQFVNGLAREAGASPPFAKYTS